MIAAIRSVPSLTGLALFILGLILTIVGYSKGGEPHYRPRTLNRPPVSINDTASSAEFKWVNNVNPPVTPVPESPVKVKVSKGVCCSEACTCGCNEGEVCKCKTVQGTATMTSPQYVPSYQPLPLFQQPQTTLYQPTLSLPGVGRYQSFGGFQMRGSGSNCSSGG